MSDPSGFVGANDPRYRNSPGNAAGTSAGASADAGIGSDAAGAPGASTRSGSRPFTGFDRERAAYERLKLELLARAEGKYVVLVGEELEGPVDSFGDALRAGYRRFGRGPLYVKRVHSVESVVEVSRDIVPCRS
jgi:hypothetical protein